VGCCVALGTLENKPFSVAKIAAYMHLPRDIVTRRLERLVQHWGVIERRGRHYYLRPEIANMPQALASYREVRRVIQRTVEELSILDAAEH
jgi:DNA-binding IclR family transcriptional regulator